MVHIQRNVALFQIFADTWDLHGSEAGQLDLRFFDFSVIILYSYTPGLRSHIHPIRLWYAISRYA